MRYLSPLPHTSTVRLAKWMSLIRSAAQLDAAQPEALGQREGELVEQRVAAGAGEQPQQGRLLGREAAPAGFGPGRLAKPQGDVVGGVALLDEVGPQVPEGADRVLLGGAAGAAALVASASGEDVLGDQVGQVTGADRGGSPSP